MGIPDVAVCLLPGTELAFDAPVAYDGFWPRLFQAFQYRSSTARFRQINMDIPDTHHDALEFYSGLIMLLGRLSAGQRATVLQLPVNPNSAKHARGHKVHHIDAQAFHQAM